MQSDHLSSGINRRVLISGLALLPALSGMPDTAAGQHKVTAVDILLEPDETMIKNAVAANKRRSRFFPRALLWARHTHRTSRPCSGTTRRRISTRFTKPSARSWPTRNRPAGS
jgi:hypothetical protein